MIRPMQFAGSFYPSSSLELESMIEAFLKNATPQKPDGKIQAIISPHAGYIYSGLVAAYGYKLLQNNQYKEVILLGPSHQVPCQGLAICDFNEWETPLGNVPVSKNNESILKYKMVQLLNKAHIAEHSIEVQLPFLQTVLKKFSILPITTGSIEKHKEVAETLNKYSKDTTFIIVSSDLSHYLPYDDAQRIDNKTTESILDGELDISHDRACGADGILILMHLAKMNNWKATLLDYRNSGDTAGDKQAVVGYASIAFTE